MKVIFMSKFFTLPDEVVNPVANAAYRLQNDVLAGFNEAVRRNQQMLAMEYLVHIVNTMAAQFDKASVAEAITFQQETSDEHKIEQPKATARRSRTLDTTSDGNAESADA